MPFFFCYRNRGTISPSLTTATTAAAAEVRAAVRSAGAGDVSTLAFDRLNALPLLTAALHEVMRLWPVVANGPFREISHDGEGDAVRGDGLVAHLRPGTAFQVPHSVMHLHPRLWGDDADRFDLDRPGCPRWNRDAFMPFSCSPRDCLGQHFAMASMRVTLATLLCRAEFAPPPGEAPKKEGHNWATLQPENGVRVVIGQLAPAPAPAPRL